MSISKRDALNLAADIKRAAISAHAVAQRSGTGGCGAYAGFIGGLEIVIGHFIRMHCDGEAGAAIEAAFNYQPTEADIAERNARLAAPRKAAA